MSNRNKLYVVLALVIIVFIGFILFPKALLLTAGTAVVGFLIFAGIRSKNKTSARHTDYEDDEQEPARGNTININLNSRPRNSETCPHCKGKGEIEVPMMGIQRGGVGITPKFKKCRNCGGSGKV